MDLFGKYYGVDWLAMVMTFLSLYCFGAKKRYGFIFGVLANISWLIFGILAQSVATPIANVAFMALNIRGYWKWKK